jgi:hypothetical protein
MNAVSRIFFTLLECQETTHTIPANSNNTDLAATYKKAVNNGDFVRFSVCFEGLGAQLRVGIIGNYSAHGFDKGCTLSQLRSEMCLIPLNKKAKERERNS